MERIPLGPSVAIEFLGPLTVVALRSPTGCRRDVRAIDSRAP
jgi:threonine/homoserine efflux transporter RhtA